MILQKECKETKPVPYCRYIGLLKYSPFLNTFEEPDAPDYARQKCEYFYVKNGEATNQTPVQFGPAKHFWGSLLYVGVFDAPVGGHLLYYHNSSIGCIGHGDMLTFPPGSIKMTLL